MTPTEQILGIKFFKGDVGRAVALMSERGGFLVAPSVTCFARLRRDDAYREAMVNADKAIPDSDAMVVHWRLFGGRKLTRITGWTYIHGLISRFVADEQGDGLCIW